MYNRPTDQYKESMARKMIEELNIIIPCRLSCVKSYRELLFGEGLHPHAGTLCHICILDRDHKDPKNKDHSLTCKCICGVEFYGWS